MQRAFELDVLSCPACNGRMRLLVLIEKPSVARRILRHLGMRDHPPPINPPRFSPDCGGHPRPPRWPLQCAAAREGELVAEGFFSSTSRANAAYRHLVLRDRTTGETRALIR